MGKKLNFKFSKLALFVGSLILIVSIAIFVVFNTNSKKSEEEIVKQYQNSVNDIDKKYSEGDINGALSILDTQAEKAKSEGRRDWVNYYSHHKAGIYIEKGMYDDAIKIYEVIIKDSVSDEEKANAYYSLYNAGASAEKPKEIVLGYKEKALEYMKKSPEKFSRQLFNLEDTGEYHE